MSDASEPSPESQDRGEASQEREWAEVQQDLLRDEVLRRKEFREIFEAHEKVIAEKVRQLRTERGWSQDDLARRMEDMGWPMHQTTVAKLEAAKRPIRAAEVYALAMVFGLPIQALWYLPVPGEPWPIERMREEFQRIQDRIAATEGALKAMYGIYADQQTERIRLARVLDDAAKAAPDSPRPRDLDPDILRETAEALEARAQSARRLAERGITERDARTHMDLEALAGIGVRFEHRGDGLPEDDQAEASPEGRHAEENGT